MFLISNYKKKKSKKYFQKVKIIFSFGRTYGRPEVFLLVI